MSRRVRKVVFQTGNLIYIHQTRKEMAWIFSLGPRLLADKPPG